MREATCYHHMGYSFRLAARVLLYASSHIQDNTYHSLCYTSRGTLAGTRNSSMGRSDDPSHHERTLLPRSYISLPLIEIRSRSMGPSHRIDLANHCTMSGQSTRSHFSLHRPYDFMETIVSCRVSLQCRLLWTWVSPFAKQNISFLLSCKCILALKAIQLHRQSMGYIGTIWDTSVVYGIHRQCMDTSEVYGYIGSVWDTSALYGIHRQSMGYIGSVWDTSAVYGIYRHCMGYIGSVHSCIRYIGSVWDTSAVYGIHRQCMGYIGTVWDTSAVYGIHRQCMGYIGTVWNTSAVYGIHRKCMGYIGSVCDTSAVYGIHRQCMGYIGSVWYTSAVYDIDIRAHSWSQPVVTLPQQLYAQPLPWKPCTTGIPSTVINRSECQYRFHWTKSIPIADNVGIF